MCWKKSSELHLICLRQADVLFVHSSAQIDRPFEVVEDLFLASPSVWFPSVVESAYEEGELVFRAKVGVGRSPIFGKMVSVIVGDPLTRPGRTVLPLRVEAVGASGLFPQLDADLEIVELGSNSTKLTLKGSYRPPLGAAGVLLDRALLHRVAEAVVKRLVEGVGEMLDAPNIKDPHSPLE